jgi:hypothetical protein
MLTSTEVLGGGIRVPMAWVVFMVFDWKSDRNGDVWEIERRISLEEVRELARWLTKCARTAQRYRGAFDLWISSTAEIFKPLRSGRF